MNQNSEFWRGFEKRAASLTGMMKGISRSGSTYGKGPSLMTGKPKANTAIVKGTTPPKLPSAQPPAANKTLSPAPPTPKSTQMKPIKKMKPVTVQKGPSGVPSVAI